MADYETDVTTLSFESLLNELTYHAQRVSYHGIRLEERWFAGTVADKITDYRFNWMGEEIRYLAKIHDRLVEMSEAAKQKEDA